MQHNNDTNDAVQQKMQTLRNLLATGKKNGKLSLKEISDALSVLQLDSEEVDKIYETLENEGIEIEGADVLATMGGDEDASFSPGQVEEVPEEELVDAAALAEGFAIDDPVRMYLKEIGKVDLLSPDEEVKLAQQMLEGSQAKEILVLAVGEEKAKAVFDMLYARDDSVIPAAFLQIPANVTVYADSAAGSKL